ncbi:MAG TPA: tRNA lysidine(34) synthetase TilS [Bacteroidota bacterium]|nr:tRNA lysidine(34) synthetase TilS [Bacteroidota bacterium]
MSEQPLIRDLENFLQRYKLIAPGEQVILAVSGGVDSIVLLDAMVELKSQLHLGLVIAHFNHQLRGVESDEDEEFVRTKSVRYGLQCYIEKANTAALSEVNKRSIQETARDLRYGFLTKLRTSIGFQKIATAHHANDNAETILLNLVRGTGIHGLTGIPVMRKDIAVIRPLLSTTREHIAEYANQRGLTFREDSSNAKLHYTRNFLRHQVMPLIQENINPNVIGTLRRTADVFEQVEQYVLNEVGRIVPKLISRTSDNEIRVDLNGLEGVPLLLQEYVLQHVAREFTKTEIDFNLVRAMMGVAQSVTGAAVSVSKDGVCYRNRDQLIFSRDRRLSSYRYLIQLDKEYDFEYFHFGSATVPRADFTGDPRVEYVDGSTLSADLILRTWNDGDAFVPLGMNEKKKVSDFFIDEKVPLIEKHSIPLLISDDEIVWICGERLDDRYKVTDATRTIIRLEYYPRS